VWAAGARTLSDRQLDNVHAGADADADAYADAYSKSSAKARTDIDAESSAKARTSGVAKSKLAVDIDNKCAAKECELEVKSANGNNFTGTGDNAQSIANTVASVNAVQINVSAGGGTQSNMAYSAEGAISQIDSAHIAVGTAALFGHADGNASSASHATSAGAGGSGNSSVTNNSTPTASATANDQGNLPAFAVAIASTSSKAKAKSDADAAAASSASSASTSASSSATSGGAVSSSTASSALAAYSPKVQVKNRCAAKECELEVRSANGNTASTGNNAQSILNTVVSVNAVQMNVSNATATQSNIAFSSVK
jgi:hypothetical protein